MGSVYNRRVLGLTDEIIDKYIKYLANRRLSNIGMEPLYADVGITYEMNESFSAVNKSETDFSKLSYSGF